MTQSNAVAKSEAPAGDIMESVLLKGDIGKLTPEERVTYYKGVCESVGLNPLTRPLEYITLNGKLTLYARRDAADQLRKIHGVSIEILSQRLDGGLLTVHVRAKDKTGRTDEDLGVVNIGSLRGEAAANAMLKAVTKAKRRVTLSIAGLGFLDETEVEDIPNRGFPRPTGNGAAMERSEDTGELISEEQLKVLRAAVVEVEADEDLFCRYMKVDSLDALPASQFGRAIAALDAKRAKK